MNICPRCVGTGRMVEISLRNMRVRVELRIVDIDTEAEADRVGEQLRTDLYIGVLVDAIRRRLTEP